MFTGLDVGTTKICCIIGARDESESGIRILGVGAHPSEGMDRGRVCDLEKTVDAIQQAVHKARAVATTSVDNVYVGIAGDHISCVNAEAEIDVANPERGVSEADRLAVIDKARKVSLERGYEAIQVIPQEYICDRQGGVHNPLTHRCQRLGVRVHVITALVAQTQNILHCVNQAGLRTRSITLQSLASSMAVLNDELKKGGCALIDIGGGTTDISVFRQGAIRYSAVIPDAGDVVTQEIADGLGISRYDAENVKKRFGHALPEAVSPDETFEAVCVLKENRVRVSRRELADLIGARMESILTRVRDQLVAENLLDELSHGVVLTGGASLTSGLVDMAERVFGKPAKIGIPDGVKGMFGPVSSPIYSTGVGLVEYGVLHGRRLSGRPKPLRAFKDFVRSVMDYY